MVFQVFCDAGTPSYNPIDYDPRRLDNNNISTTSTIIPPDTKPPETPAHQAPPKTDAAKAECPVEHKN